MWLLGPVDGNPVWNLALPSLDHAFVDESCCSWKREWRIPSNECVSSGGFGEQRVQIVFVHEEFACMHSEGSFIMSS